MTISSEQADELESCAADVVPYDGALIGALKCILRTDDGGLQWASVAAGWDGRWQTLVPIDGSTLCVAGLRVVFDLSTVRDAPQVGDDLPLWPEEEKALYDHYGRHLRTSFGDPPRILPGEDHDGIWAVQRELDFPGFILGLDRPTDGESRVPTITERTSRTLGRHREDRPI